MLKISLMSCRETPELSRGKESVTRASVHTLLTAKWVKCFGEKKCNHAAAPDQFAPRLSPALGRVL